MQSPNADVIVPVSGRKWEAECSRPGTDITPEDERCDQRVAPESARRSEKKAAPEKEIILWAVCLALLENAGSGLSTLNFIWATVVLLGGFAQTLQSIDFWFVTAILTANGVRLYGRSGDMAAEVATIWPDYEKAYICMKLYSIAMQWYSALASVVLSSLRLARQHYGGIHNVNRDRALSIFYCLSLAEGILSLIGFYLKETYVVKSEEYPPQVNWFASKFRWLPQVWIPWIRSKFRWLYQVWIPSKFRWLYQVWIPSKFRWLPRVWISSKFRWLPEINKDLVSMVNTQYGLDKSELFTVRRFFYETYSRCINGSVVDGLKMKFVPYILELLQSSDGSEQLTGARVLSMLVKNKQFASETLRAIAAIRGVVERLMEMLNCENPDEQEIRKAAAEIISKLVHGDWNCIQVTAIAGSIESIASLLYSSDQIERQKLNMNPSEEYDYSGFSVLGLEIMKRLADDHDNCTKIRCVRGLLPKIIGLSELNPNNPESQIEIAKLALQLIGILAASSTGSTGKRIWEIVFARNVLQKREIWTHGIQILAIDTLTSLAREQEGREIIGRTDGVLRNLFSVFFMERINNNNEREQLVTKAGEALGFLSLENKHNCQIMMNIEPQRYQPNWITDLISALNDPVQGILAARILRNLLAYAEADCDDSTKLIIAETAQVVVSHVMDKQGVAQEAAIGLAAQMFEFMAKLKMYPELREQRSLISKLVEILRRHPCPSEEVPSITRFSIELLIAVMEMNRSTILELKSVELVEVLEEVMKTPSSELHSYCTFSGTATGGLSRQRMAIRSLVQSAMVLLCSYSNTPA